MGLEDLRRWQWAAVGLIAGLAFGGVQAYHGPNLDDGFDRTLNSQREFENGVVLPVDDKGGRYFGSIFDITIHPKDESGKTWLTFMQVYPGKDRTEGIGRRVRFFVSDPYKPIAQIPTDPKPDLTVSEYLGDLKEKFPQAQIQFRYAWWEVPRNTLAIGAVAGLVLIGGIWPSVVGLLTGGGIWGPKRREKPAMDMSRYGNSDNAAPSGASAGMTDADRAQMEDMENAMLANLGGFGVGGRESDSVDEDVPTVKPLTGGPLEGGAAAAAARAEAESKEYKGDFYPVARPGGKKDEE